MFGRMHFACASLAACLAMLVAGNTASFGQDGKSPVKVFILAGQSNMEGQGAEETIDWLGEDAEYGHLLGQIKGEGDSWAVRDDVWVHYSRNRGPLKKGKLTVGFGVRDDKIGPELMFGHAMGDLFDNPVLLIKACWGGASIAEKFRPPSSGGETGEFYTRMLETVRDVLGDLGGHFPEFEGRDYDLAGFVWFQGWNDLRNLERNAEYEENLVNLIKDLREEFEAPNLPVVIGELGVGGRNETKPNEKKDNFRRAQASAAARPEFAGTVGFVETSKYWDDYAAGIMEKGWIKRKWVDEALHEEWKTMGSQPAYHYLGSGKIFSLIGYGFGESMKELLSHE